MALYRKYTRALTFENVCQADVRAAIMFRAGKKLVLTDAIASLRRRFELLSKR